MIKRDFYQAQTVFQSAFNFESENTPKLLELLPAFKQINKIISDINESKKAILADCAEIDENGNMKREHIEGGESYVIQPDKKTEFIDKFNALLDEEVAMDKCFPLSLATEMKMTMAEILAIEFILDASK